MTTIYWSELAGGAIGELDPTTGTIARYPSPSKGALHTLRADSKGNVWYTAVYGTSRIGRLDAATKTIVEWDPSRSHANAHYYGIVVDTTDRVWATANTAHVVVRFDQRTQEWMSFPTPTPSAGPRRPTIDSMGRIWFSEHLNDALAMLDPESGKITEYKSPLSAQRGVRVLRRSRR
jgi:virginiamycin B lyase